MNFGDMIEIKDISGKTRFSTPLNKGAKGKFTLMKEDYIILPFSVAEPIPFKLGDYVDLARVLDESLGGKLAKIYEIIDIQKPTYNSFTGGYDYELRLDAYYWKWKNKIFKYTPEHAGSEASWSLTATLDVQLGVFLRNLKALGYTYKGTDFIFSIDSTVENKAIAMTYDNVNLLDALFSMAGEDKWNCDCWITDNVIHFGRNEFGDSVKIERDIEASNIIRNESQGTYATRIYAFGSTKNIPTNYRPTDEQAVVNGVVQKRLMLPANTPYIDAYENMSQEEAIEDVVIFDDVYPRRIGSLSDVHTRTEKVRNEDGTKETVTYYRYKDTGLEFKKEYIIEGQELQITFQSGKLNGMVFGVIFNPSPKDESRGEQLWEIVRNENYGRLLPDDIIRPENNDEYVLSGFNIQLVSDQYIPKAEQELKEKAQKYADKAKKDDGTYPTTLRSSWVYEDPISRTFEFGQRINLVDDTYFDSGRISRVLGWEFKLDIPWDAPVYTIGESMPYSRISEIEEKVDALTYKGQTYFGNGSGVYLIKVNDSTAASESNAYSALRSLKMFARKDIEEFYNFFVNFLAGTSFGNYIKGESGANIDKNGTAELASLLLRGALTIGDYIEKKQGGKITEQGIADLMSAIVRDKVESADFLGGELGQGFTLKKKENGRSYLEIDELFVRIKAFFTELEIKKISYVGGNFIFSPAGIVLSNVEETETGYKCYFTNDDGTAVTENLFRVDDLCLCQTFNIKPGVHQNVVNKRYWRACTEIDENYFILSKTDCESNSDIPGKGDSVVVLGNKTDIERQNAIIISVYGEGSPSITQYIGINTYSLVGSEKTRISPTQNIFTGEFHFSSGENVQDITTGLNQKVNDAVKTLTEQAEYITAIQDDLEAVKNQADGAIESWFYDPAPTLKNEPAVNWTDDATRKVHLGDLYYDGSGKSYRFQLVDGKYTWKVIEDSDIARALAAAKAAQDTADGKRRVLVTQPTSESVYDVGDLWVNATYSNTYSNDFLRCKTAKAKGTPFSIEHWEKATKYTDDTAANKAIADAANAQQAADNADQKAQEATNRLNNWAADGTVSPTEKPALKDEIARIDSDKEQITDGYTKYGLGTPSAFTSAYSSYRAQLVTLTASSPESITIPSDFRTKQTTYYTQRSTALNAIAAAAKDYAKNLVDGLEFGGRNFIKSSDFIVQATSNEFAPTKTISLVDGLNLNDVFLGKKVVFSYFVHCPGERTNNPGQGSLGNRFGIHGLIQWKNKSTGATTSKYPFADCLAGSYENQRVSMTYTFEPPSGYDTLSYIQFSFQPYARPSADNTEIWKIGQPKLEIGTKATDWTPAPEDVQAGIDEARQKADAAKDLADSASQEATNAANAAAQANALLADIANDNKLTAQEKQQTQKEWDAIKSEKPKNDASADKFGVSKTAYGNAYSALNSYITPLLSNLTTTSDITGTEFRSKFKAYYDARTDLLNAISAKAKTLADAAQEAADNAQNSADAAIASAQKAQQAADEAKNRLNSWAADNVISPTEKQAIKDEIVRIDADNSEIVSGYNRYNAGTPTEYNTAYIAYKTVLTSLSAATPETITIPSDFASKQSAYYTQRTAALNVIASKAKAQVDSVNNDLQGYKTTVESKFSATNDKITAAVTETKTYTDTSIGNLQIGGTNLLLNTSKNPEQANKVYKIYDMSTMAKVGQTYTLSFKYEANTSGGSGGIEAITKKDGVNVDGFGSRKIFNLSNSGLFTFTFECASEFNNIGIYSNWNASYYEWKLEIGNKATDWSPAPEDVSEQIVSETKAQIQVAKGEITAEVTSTVDNKINNIQVGGRNLLKGTKDFNGWIEFGGTVILDESMLYQGLIPSKAVSKWAYRYTSYDFEVGKTYTISAWVRTNIENQILAGCYTWTTTVSELPSDYIIIPKANTWVKYVYTFTAKKSVTERVRIESPNATTTNPLWVCGIKLEEGNKATDWSPAPEDTEKSISDLSARITITEEGIKQTVTKTEFNQSKTEILNTAAQDALNKANTAKNEAISTASSDATNKANNAKNEAISTAATDATNKVNAIQVGGRNLALRTSSSYSQAFTNFSGVTNTCALLGKVLTDGLSVGDTITIRLVYKYADIVATSGKTAQCWIQGSGNVTQWGGGNFPGSVHREISGSGEFEFLYSYRIDGNHIKNQYWDVNIRHDYVQSGSVQWRMFKVEKGTKATDWTPAPEDISSNIDTAKKDAISTAATDAQAKADAAKNAAIADAAKKYATITTVTQMQTSIDSLGTELSLKASKSELTTVKNELTGNIDSLSQRVTQAEINLKPDNIWIGISSKVDSVVNDMQIGGRNYFGFNKTTISPTYAEIDKSINGIILNPKTTSSNYIICRITNLKLPNVGYYAVSFYIKASEECVLKSVNLCDATSKNRTLENIQVTTDYKKVSGIFYANAYISSPYYGFLDFEDDGKLHEGIKIYIKDLKVEQGTKATDWTPAPEDYSTTEEIKTGIIVSQNSINILGKSISLTGMVTFTSLASDAQGKINTAQSTANSAQTAASNAQNTANSAKTTADSALSKANTAQSTAETARTEKIELARLGTTIIDGGHLITSLIDADELFSQNITVSNNATITNLRAVNADVTGKLIANSGSQIGGMLVGSYSLTFETTNRIARFGKDVLPASTATESNIYLKNYNLNSFKRGIIIDYNNPTSSPSASIVDVRSLNYGIFASAGNMYFAPGSLMDIPGVLIAGRVYWDGNVGYRYGKKRLNLGKYSFTVDKPASSGWIQYNIVHNLGHQNYTVNVTPISKDSDFRKYHPHIIDVQNDNFIVCFIDSGTANSTLRSDFYFTVIGENTTQS